jgi:mercuric reductase
MSSSSKYDLVILGSGSTAFAAALRAQELGKSAVMTEERTLGGTCVNRGCLPSKNLIEAARLVYDASHPRYPGLSPAVLGLDFGKLVAQKDEVVTQYRQKKYESLLGARFDIAEGHATFVDPHTLEVGGKRLTGDRVLIATGSRPVLPDIDGLSDVPFLTSDLLTSSEAVELKELPRSLLIIGGGYIALELGQMFHRFGSEVTLIERSEGVLAHGYELEVGTTLAAALEAEGVRIVTRARVRSVRPHGAEVVAVIEAGHHVLEVCAEKLLVATGSEAQH